LPNLEILSKEMGFAAILRDSISEGMTKVLGAGGTQAILYHLDLHEVDDPKKIHDKLFAILGPGTVALERVIVQSLHQSLALCPASGTDGDFAKQVELARQSFDAVGGSDSLKRARLG